jgi:threonine dehydrogenase-like Zn-dependent dehydrogenase
VRAVQFDMADPAFPASLVELDEPHLPGAGWARVAVTAGGICGSDLHLFAHNTGPSPTLAALGAFPFVLGHEIAGRVVEAGAGCPWPEGTRVAVDPCIPCLPRGIDPPCTNCARGWTSSCLNLDSRIVSSGRSLGFTTNLGGGWSEQVLAHVSMLHPLPDEVPDQAACLHEPISIACHGLLRAPPDDGDPVLVVGAGIIGLASVAALKGLFPRCPVTVLARHPHQAEAAVPTSRNWPSWSAPGWWAGRPTSC